MLSVRGLMAQNDSTVRTSESRWLHRLARAYKLRLPVTLVDDAGTGVDPQHQTLFEMAKKTRLRARDWTALLIAVGMSAAGAWMVVAAIADPEPTSKLGLLVGGGIGCVLGGGLSAIRILTGMTPPNVTLGASGIHISWE